MDMNVLVCGVLESGLNCCGVLECVSVAIRVVFGACSGMCDRGRLSSILLFYYLCGCNKTALFVTNL